MLIDISDRQLHQDFQDIETFSRFYLQFHQHDMQSFIHFVLWLNHDISSVLIIRDEYWSITNECALNRAANLLPGVLFVVELESYHKNDHFVNIYNDMTVPYQSLQIV